MNFEQARFNMVEQQVRPWEVLDQGVLDSLMTVRREEFVPAGLRNLAFSEAEIPLAGASMPDQLMLKPVIEGKVLQAVQVRPGDNVLEIGAGSGYFAALLAARAEWVRTVDIDPAMARLAAENLARYGVENVIVEDGDAAQGWPARAPYDLIVVSGGMPMLPASLLAQIKVGGRLFAFVGEAPLMKARLVRCVAPEQFQCIDLFETVVPMLQNVQRHDSFSF